MKQLPRTGSLSWPAIFGRAAPAVLDLGCGNGRYLIGSAMGRPDHNHFGLDVKPVVIRYATKRANQRGLTNVRFAVANARDFLQRLVPSHSVAEIHLYHPQPYYDITLVHRRLITPEFVMMLHRRLVPGGLLVAQTDNPGYWRYMRELFSFFFEWQELAERWPDAPQGRTRREIVALQRGLPIYRGQGSPRTNLDEVGARHIAEQLPLPIFDASQELRELDRLD